ncbi:DUF1552 domain-containing protein, partial [Akkermansiaceae bacterium]|nr:DUF1552 domain-containing protein [Akkermansiaceae bacterium]
MNINRRSFLKGVGVSIGLPFLHSMPLFGQSKVTPLSSNKRMVFVSTGLGMNPGQFFPKEYGYDFRPTIALKSMQKHKGKYTVFSNMDHPRI